MKIDITPDTTWKGSQNRIALHKNYTPDGTGGEQLVLDVMVGRKRVARFEPSGYTGGVEKRFDVDEILRTMAKHRREHRDFAFYSNVSRIDEIMRDRVAIEVHD